MADFNVYPSLQGQSPDILGSYLRGAQGGLQMAYAPQQLQQETTLRGLNIEQLRQTLGPPRSSAAPSDP